MGGAARRLVYLGFTRIMGILGNLRSDVIHSVVLLHWVALTISIGCALAHISSRYLVESSGPQSHFPVSFTLYWNICQEKPEDQTFWRILIATRDFMV